MVQRGRLDRRVVAHSGSIVALDWFSAPFSHTSDENVNQATSGWVASGGLDRCVKIWELPADDSKFPDRPSYTLHPSFPVRRVYWRPEYESELAIVSNAKYARGSDEELVNRKDMEWNARAAEGISNTLCPCVGDALEIWDVRRAWVAKWEVRGSAVEGGFTGCFCPSPVHFQSYVFSVDVAFADSHAIWAQHRSGTFSQFDLRETVKPLDAIPRVAIAWKPSGTLAFALDHRKRLWEIPYDDV
jgi:WD repeat-containing protein 24